MTDKDFDPKEVKVVFAEGCFDHFNGTQEELDELIASINQAIESGKLFELGEPMSDEEFDELPEEIKLQLLAPFDDSIEAPKRTLQ